MLYLIITYFLTLYITSYISLFPGPKKFVQALKLVLWKQRPDSDAMEPGYQWGQGSSEDNFLLFCHKQHNEAQFECVTRILFAAHSVRHRQRLWAKQPLPSRPRSTDLRQSPRRRRAAGPAAIMIVPTLTVTMEAPNWQSRPCSAATAVLVPFWLTSIALWVQTWNRALGKQSR